MKLQRVDAQTQVSEFCNLSGGKNFFKKSFRVFLSIKDEKTLVN